MQPNGLEGEGGIAASESSSAKAGIICRDFGKRGSYLYGSKAMRCYADLV